MKINPDKRFLVPFSFIKAAIDLYENYDYESGTDYFDIFRQEVQKFKDEGGLDPVISELLPDKVSINCSTDPRSFRVMMRSLKDRKEEEVKVKLISVFGSLLKVQKENGHIMAVPFKSVHPEDRSFVYQIAMELRPYDVAWESNVEPSQV